MGKTWMLIDSGLYTYYNLASLLYAIYSIDFELQPGGNHANPQKLTSVSDWVSKSSQRIDNLKDAGYRGVGHFHAE